MVGTDCQSLKRVADPFRLGEDDLSDDFLFLCVQYDSG